MAPTRNRQGGSPILVAFTARLQPYVRAHCAHWKGRGGRFVSDAAMQAALRPLGYRLGIYASSIVQRIRAAIRIQF